MGASALLLPDFSAYANPIDPLQALDKIDVKIKKELADVALNAAKAKGATYTDVRIGRYLNQFVATRDKRVQGVANTES
ncbi:MAG: TldD/PmbA family protein, partial [Pedobacter sp.]